MKKTVFTLLLIFFVFSAKAQVTIGANEAPDKQAVLDLRSGTSANKGLLLPRVQLGGADSTSPFTDSFENPLSKGMTVYHTGGNKLKEGIYIWSGDIWEPQGDSWFFMPSIVFDTSGPDPDLTLEKDLYGEYVKQFQTNAVGSEDAPSLLSLLPERTDFYYYVAGCDADVFEIIGIDVEGKLSYKVKQEATDATYINIVFVRKS